MSAAVAELGITPQETQKTESEIILQKLERARKRLLRRSKTMEEIDAWIEEPLKDGYSDTSHESLFGVFVPDPAVEALNKQALEQRNTRCVTALLDLSALDEIPLEFLPRNLRKDFEDAERNNTPPPTFVTPTTLNIRRYRDLMRTNEGFSTLHREGQVKLYTYHKVPDTDIGYLKASTVEEFNQHFRRRTQSQKEIELGENAKLHTIYERDALGKPFV